MENSRLLLSYKKVRSRGGPINVKRMWEQRIYTFWYIYE